MLRAYYQEERQHDAEDEFTGGLKQQLQHESGEGGEMEGSSDREDVLVPSDVGIFWTFLWVRTTSLCGYLFADVSNSKG